MGALRQLLKFNGTMRSLGVGLLVAGLLGGCTQPFVNVIVQVDTPSCQAGEGKTIESPPPPGGCNNGGTGLIVVSPNTICKNASGTPINCQSSFMCSAGNKCLNGNPGTENRKACKTIWTQTSGNNGSCTCTSNY